MNLKEHTLLTTMTILLKLFNKNWEGSMLPKLFNTTILKMWDMRRDITSKKSKLFAMFRLKQCKEKLDRMKEDYDFVRKNYEEVEKLPEIRRRGDSLEAR